MHRNYFPGVRIKFRSGVLLLLPAIVLVLLSCSPESYYLQKNPKNLYDNLSPVPAFSLSGKVIEEGSGQPVDGAQVFIGNTSVYSYTGADGSYTIRNIPSGNYKLVVFADNMDPFVQNITVESNISGAVVRLPFANSINEKESAGQRIKQLENEILSLRRKKLSEKKFIIENLAVYLKGLDVFRNMIAGGGDMCRILNEESLIVQSYKVGSRTTYEFSGNEPIEILNLHLGYKLKILLNRTLLSSGYNGYAMKNDAIVCFEELNPADYENEISGGWALNRLESFYGSERHFLMALSAHQLEEEGFEITLPPIREIRTKMIPGDSKTILGSTGEESFPFDYPYSILRKGGTEEFENALYFQLELEVWYRHYYLTANEKQFAGADKYPVSRITLLHIPAIFNSNGIMANKNNLVSTGYWAVDQFYKMLPENYLPPRFRN